MGSQQLSIEHWIRLPSSILIMKTILCLAAIVAVSSAFLPGLPAPPPPPPHYGRPGYPRPSPLGGALGGGHGKGGFNPLLFSLLGGCTEQHRPCTKIADANADATKQCGNDQGTACGGATPPTQKCNKCCTCN